MGEQSDLDKTIANATSKAGSAAGHGIFAFFTMLFPWHRAIGTKFAWAAIIAVILAVGIGCDPFGIREETRGPTISEQVDQQKQEIADARGSAIEDGRDYRTKPLENESKMDDDINSSLNSKVGKSPAASQAPSTGATATGSNSDTNGSFKPENDSKEGYITPGGVVIPGYIEEGDKEKEKVWKNPDDMLAQCNFPIPSAVKVQCTKTLGFTDTPSPQQRELVKTTCAAPVADQPVKYRKSCTALPKAIEEFDKMIDSKFPVVSAEERAQYEASCVTKTSSTKVKCNDEKSRISRADRLARALDKEGMTLDQMKARWTTAVRDSNSSWESVEVY